LRHLVGGGEIKSRPEKTKAIRKFSMPQNMKAVQSFLLLTDRKTINDFAAKRR